MYILVTGIKLTYHIMASIRNNQFGISLSFLSKGYLYYVCL